MKPLKMVHEDPDIFAIDKPEGLSSIAERDLTVPCAQRLLEEERGEKLFVVHRLDKEVSGLLLFARNAETHRALSMAFEQRKVRKTYLAVATGVLEGRGLIDEPITEFGSGRMGVHATKGKDSQTEWKAIRPLAGATLIEAHPITGRRHQIRVHLYGIGHPIHGDPRYGDAKARSSDRLMLHGHALSVVLAGEELSLVCEPPPSFQAVVDRLNSTLEPK